MLYLVASIAGYFVMLIVMRLKGFLYPKEGTLRILGVLNGTRKVCPVGLWDRRSVRKQVGSAETSIDVSASVEDGPINSENSEDR